MPARRLGALLRLKDWGNRFLRAAPYLVTAAVLVTIFHKYPASEIAHQVTGGRALRVLPFALTMPFVLWLPYAFYDRVVFEGAIGPMALGSVVRAKAASAVLLTLGYFVGGGGYAVWVARTTRTGAPRAAGAILYVMASDLTAVCAVAGPAMWLGGPDIAPSLRRAVTWIFAVQIWFILAGPHAGFLRLPELFAAWRLVPRGRSLVQIAGRAGNIVILTAFTWGAMRAFGLEVPARAAAMYVPVIVLVTSLPINVAGLGAAQAAWLLLLPWASGPRLLAFHALWHVSSGIGILARGVPFLRGVTREIQDGRLRDSA
jgi:hypothetical protein